MGIKGTIQKLKETIAPSYQYVGTVQSVNLAQGTSMVQTPAGGSQVVRGTAWAVGEKVVVKDGEIVSKAPVASYYEFEV